MTTTTYRREAASAHQARFIPDFLNKISARVGSYVALSRAEGQLQQLDDRLLLDIGVKRADIAHMVWGR